MPEWPDLDVYRQQLQQRLVGQTVVAVAAPDPFLLRTVVPPLSQLVGRTVQSVELLGKRLVFGFDGDLFAVLHLMVLGRLHWQSPIGKLAKTALWHLDVAPGRLWLTESGKKRKASLHVLQGRAALAAHDRGGIDVFATDPAEFARVLRAAPRTVKRALCDPAVVAAIGNAYSDEILHAAQLSPLQRTANLSDDELLRLWHKTREVLLRWRDRLQAEAAGGFPEHVTAFRPEMAVHGKFGKPCPVCAAPVQRIVYADNECNYCARCQTGGRLLSDRALAQLLKDSWPKYLD
ncbi:MAG: formamidopyrimidine-DNA glycosylase [Deltaproteobacteria bacterium]|nr:formamidopyrimidine-DNA glycosylase [Deltaproteobacteria bacterium]